MYRKLTFLLLFVQSVAFAQTSLNLPSMTEPDIDDAEARSEWETSRLADPSTGRIPYAIRREELEFAICHASLSKTITWSSA